MSAADDVLFALKKHFRQTPDADDAAFELLSKYDAEVLAAATTHGRLRDFTPVWTLSPGTFRSRLRASSLKTVLSFVRSPISPLRAIS